MGGGSAKTYNYGRGSSHSAGGQQPGDQGRRQEELQGGQKSQVKKVKNIGEILIQENPFL